MCQEVPILPRNTLNLYLLFLEMIFNSVVLLVTAYSAAQGFCIHPDLGPVSSAELSLSGYSRVVSALSLTSHFTVPPYLERSGNRTAQRYYDFCSLGYQLTYVKCDWLGYVGKINTWKHANCTVTTRWILSWYVCAALFASIPQVAD